MLVVLLNDFVRLQTAGNLLRAKDAHAQAVEAAREGGSTSSALAS